MDLIRQLEQRLQKALWRQRLVLLAAGLIGQITALAAVFLFLSSMAALFIIPVPLKLSLLFLGLAGFGLALHRLIVIPWLRAGDPIAAALEIEKRHPQLKGRLVAALQFDRHDFSRTNFSSILVAMTVRQAAELTATIDFNEIVSGYPIMKKLRPAAVIFILVLAVGLFFPGFFSNGYEVYSHPTTIIAPPPGFSVVVRPGNAERIKYADIDIGGDLMGGGFPDEVEVFYRFAGGRWQSEKLPIRHSARLAANGSILPVADTIPFEVALKQVRRSFDYYVIAGDLRTEQYAVNVVERPRLNSLKVTVIHPPYTGLADLILDENNGSFAAVIGSRAHLEFSANREIERGYLVINDSMSMPIRFAGAHGEIDFPVREDFSYFIRLEDRRGEQNPDPIAYTVTAVPDEYPYITVLSPGYDVNLDDRMMILFKVKIADDFGFTSLVLKYQILSGGSRSEEHVAVIDFSHDLETEGEVSFTWDLEGFNLVPSDVIVYRFEVADNDQVSGPKVTSTRQYAARLPSIDEIIAETGIRQEERLSGTERMLEEQRQMVDRLREITREMKAANQPEWQRTRELENLVEQQQKVTEELENTARDMEESIQQMERNNLLSEQIMQKMLELQKLFEEVATPEMKEAMRKLAEALKNMSPEELEEAMKQFQLSQEEMLKRLERSVDLLRRLQVEQVMAAMLKMVEDMLLEQNRVNVETEKAADADYERLVRREEKLDQQADFLRKQAERLQQLFADTAYQATDLHEQFAKAAGENQAQADMRQMETSLQGRDKKAALPSGEAASQKLKALADTMRLIITALSDDEGQKLAQAIRNAINDANLLSQKQEELLANGKASDNRVARTRALAAEQQLLRESVSGLAQRIDELGRKSPFLAAEIRSYLEQSGQRMQQACNSLGEMRGSTSRDHQKEAMYNLNRAAVKLLDGLENQNQCNKGGSCNKMSQKIESICQKQQEINQQTEAQCNNPGQMGNEGKQAMRRLAAEQGVVRQSIEEMQKELGDRRDFLGRMDALAGEMRDIEELLEEGSGSQDLIDRQLRVYSRMLDLQKSLNRRDISPERRAVSGQDIFRQSPDALQNPDARPTESWPERLNRYLQEGYPRQYEQQIKAYFRALSGMGQKSDEE